MKSILVMIVILVFHASASSVHAQWTTANGLSGGNIRSITSSGGMMYAAAYGGGVFMSSNAGSSWLKIQADSVLNMNVTAVKTFGVYLFAGTDFGAYRTSNQGAVWEKCNNGMGSPGINSFVVSGTLLYAVSNNGLFSSSDYGSSWNRLSGTFPAQDCKSLYVNGTTLYVGLYRQGMYKSVNGGSSWTAINSGLPPVAEQNPGTIIEDATGLYVSNYGAQGGIYKSSDAGSSWSYISTGLINSFVSSMYKNGAVFVVGTVDGIFRTTDNGVSFTAIATSPSTDEDIQCLYSDANGLYAGLQGSGVYRSSDNGVRWTSSNTGLSALTINNVELKNSQLYLSSIYGGHVYSSSDNGVSWQQAGTGLSQVRYGAVGASSNALLTGTYFSSGGLFYSSDNGFSWSPRSAQLLNSWIMSIKYSGSAWFAGTWGDGLYRSVDGGITWSKTDMGDAFLLNIGANANTVLAGTWGGKSIYRSGNGGVSWSVSNVGVGDGKSVQDFHYFGGSFYTAVFGMGILRSTDDGQSWVQTISGLSTSEVFSVTSSGKVLFAGTNGSGVCRSLDSGASWRVFTTNIHGLRINDMIAQNNTLIAATNGGAVFTHSVIQHEVGVLKQQAFCAGTVIKLPVNTWAQYSSGNVFRAELSDASGSFSSPVVIGTVSSVSDDTINVTIPATAVTSSKYRIRIQSSSPAQTSIFNSDEFTIFALPKPVINGQSSLCESTPNTYTVKPDSGSTVAWTVVSGGITFGSATTKDSVTVTSTSTGPAVLKCTETTVKGCTKDTTFAIAVNPVPIPVITSPTAVCTKNTMTFSVSQSANSTYQWKVKSGTIQSGGNSPSVNVVFVTSGTDSVTVVVTDTSTKCLGTASVQIAVYDVPTPAIVGQNTVCSNQTGIQYVTLQSNGTTYAWSISSGNASITGSSSSNSVSLAFGAAGTVKLVVQETNIAGCSSTDTITIQVNSSLSPQVQSSTGQFTFCAGSGITLDAGISGGAYQWYRDSTAVTGGTQQTLGVTTAGSYSVEVRKDGCQGFSTPVNVIVQQKSDVTILQNGTTLTVQGTGAYQWLDATKNPIVGASQQSYSPTIPAIYYAVITNGVCTDTSTAFAFSANPPGQVSLGICDFGIVPVSSIINNNGGHRKSIMVWNKTSSSVLLNSISIKNSGSPFGIVPNQLPRELLSGDSTEIALSFSPITSQTFTNTAVLTYNSTLSKEGPMQGTAVTVADLRVTEVELAPQRREVEPGETLSVFLRIRREEPVKSTANEYRATIDFDRRVMEYIASDDIRPRKIQQQADRRLLDISSERNGRDTLIEMKFIAKLADVDSTSLLFNGTEPFIWSDGGGKVFPSYVDSVVYVRVCKEGGKRLVTKSPGTQLLMMSPNPGGAGTVELTYSVGERTSAELFVTDIHGRKVADIASGEHDMGTHQSTVQTSDWIEGVYMVVLRTPRETVSQKLVVVR